MQFTYLVLVYNIISIRVILGQCSGSKEIISVGYEPVTMTTPGYYSSGYDLNSNCSWLVTSFGSESTLLIRVINMFVDCAGDAVNIYDGSNRTTVIHDNACSSLSDTAGRTLSYRTITSGNVYVSLTSDNRENNPTNEKGFILYMISGKDFSGTGCAASQSLEANTTEQYISSPNFPNQYTVSTTCTWVITAGDPNTHVEIDVKFLNIEENVNTCTYDYLEIKETGIFSDKVCSDDPQNDWTIGKNYTSIGNSITVVFRSDDSQVENGFLLSYTQTGDSLTTTVETTQISTILAGSDSTQNSKQNTNSRRSYLGAIFGVGGFVAGCACAAAGGAKAYQIRKNKTKPAYDKTEKYEQSQSPRTEELNSTSSNGHHKNNIVSSDFV